VDEETNGQYAGPSGCVGKHDLDDEAAPARSPRWAATWEPSTGVEGSDQGEGRGPGGSGSRRAATGGAELRHGEVRRNVGALDGVELRDQGAGSRTGGRELGEHREPSSPAFRFLVTWLPLDTGFIKY
jgi:hypothetical protein